MGGARAHLDLEGVAGEREVLVEEVRGRLATAAVCLRQYTVPVASRRACAGGARRPSERVTVSSGITTAPAPAHTHAGTRSAARTGPSTRGERGEQQPSLQGVARRGKLRVRKRQRRSSLPRTARPGEESRHTTGAYSPITFYCIPSCPHVLGSISARFSRSGPGIPCRQAVSTSSRIPEERTARRVDVGRPSAHLVSRGRPLLDRRAYCCRCVREGAL